MDYKNTETMTVAEAAKLMQKNPCFVRQGLIDGRFRFGYAVKLSDKRWNFYINRQKFFEETGIRPATEVA
jgi:hypothetical protein